MGHAPFPPTDTERSVFLHGMAVRPYAECQRVTPFLETQHIGDDRPERNLQNARNHRVLVRGLSGLKKEEPFQLPLWEVLTQYFFTWRPLEWLLPAKIAQNELAVDPSRSRRPFSEDLEG